MAKTKFIPVPPWVIISRQKLEHPKTKKLIKFSSDYRIILQAFFYCYNPFFGTNSDNITYCDIEEITEIPKYKIKKIMPVLLHNFPNLFRIDKKRGFGKGYNYKFNYDFGLKAEGKISDMPKTLQETENEYYKKLDDIEGGIWGLFKKIPLDNENKRIHIFESFLGPRDWHYWNRNVNYALKTLAGKPEWKGTVKVRWIWRCLELDYALNKLKPSERKKAVDTSPLQDVLKEHGIDTSKIFQSVN